MTLGWKNGLRPTQEIRRDELVIKAYLGEKDLAYSRLRNDNGNISTEVNNLEVTYDQLYPNQRNALKVDEGSNITIGNNGAGKSRHLKPYPILKSKTGSHDRTVTFKGERINRMDPEN